VELESNFYVICQFTNDKIYYLFETERKRKTITCHWVGTMNEAWQFLVVDEAIDIINQFMPNNEDIYIINNEYREIYTYNMRTLQDGTV